MAIYDNGCSTGLNFLVQLKSTTDWRSHLKKGGTLSYPLFVKDLTHWADTVPPVVLVLWDTTENRGFWQDIPTILGELEARGTTWQKRHSATVRIPMEHCFDGPGKAALRERIAVLSLPTISAGKELVIKPTFSFPDTLEGQASRLALIRAYEEGTTVTIGKEYISKFEMSPWWERIFGASIPDSVTIEPGNWNEVVRLNLTAIGSGQVEIVPLELQIEQAGTQLMVMSNQTSESLFRVRVTLDKRQETVDVSISYRLPSQRVLDSLQATRLLLVMARGGSLSLAPANGEVRSDCDLGLSKLPSPELLQKWLQLLTMLAEVQPRISRFGQFVLTDRFTDTDFRNAEKVYAMCTHASWGGTMHFSLLASAPPAISAFEPDEDGKSTVSIEFDPFGDVVLFGVRIPMGRVRVEFPDSTKAAEGARKAAAENSCKVHIDDGPVTLRFLEWAAPLTGPALSTEERKRSNRERLGVLLGDEDKTG